MVVSEGAINNIMGGMENTAGVRLHSHRHKLKQRFDIIRKLGQGTYGKVQLAVNKETGQEVAIKTIKKAKIETEQDLIRIRREIQIMSSVQHPQIIHIYEVFENREKMVLVMEYAAGGELYDYLSERKVLSEDEARRVFRHVASATYYCHKHKICHRDLKLENILLDLEGNAKIADFGLSNVFDEKHRLDTFCGSPLYASPEIVKGIPYTGPEVDCWSLGVLLYTLVYGAMPFDGSNFKRLVKQITQGDYYEPKKPSSASELIRSMLTVSASKRATIEDICNHWWVNEGYLESCLEVAEALANQTPVRLDLLLSLAPKHINSEHMLIQPEEEDSARSPPTSEATRPPPQLQLPPPPPPPDPTPVGAARSASLGAVTSINRNEIEALLAKKIQERKEEERKRKADETGTIDKKKKRETGVEGTPKSSRKERKSEVNEAGSSRKPPAGPDGDTSERKKSVKKRDPTVDGDASEKSDRSERKKIVKKREPVVDGDASDLSEKSERRKSVKKREPSAEKDTSESDKLERKKSVKKREPSLTREPSEDKSEKRKSVKKKEPLKEKSSSKTGSESVTEPSAVINGEKHEAGKSKDVQIESLEDQSTSLSLKPPLPKDQVIEKVKPSTKDVALPRSSSRGEKDEVGGGQSEPMEVESVTLASAPSLSSQGPTKTSGSARSIGSAASNEGTLKASDSSLSRESISPMKCDAALTTVPQETSKKSKSPSPSQTPKVRKVKSKSLVKTSSKNSVDTQPAETVAVNGESARVTPSPIPKVDATEKVLQETADKIKLAEESNIPIIVKTGDGEAQVIDTGSDVVANKEGESVSEPRRKESESATESVSSKDASQCSSMLSTPARSRAGSESSTEARPSRTDPAKRQSKIFKAAAMWENQAAQPPAPLEKPKKAVRAGGKVMTDLAKKFEEKPAVDRKSKVVPLFKVSDARKAFEQKAVDKPTVVLRKKATTESLPSSPTNKDTPILATTHSGPIISEEAKKVTPAKDSATPDIKKEKSPSKEASKTEIEREKSPRMAGKELSDKQISKSKSPVPEISKAKSPKREKSVEIKIEKEEEKKKLEEDKKKPEDLKKPTAADKPRVGADDKLVTTKTPTHTLEVSPREMVTSSEDEEAVVVGGLNLKLGGVGKISEVGTKQELRKVDSSDSSDSESEAEKLLKLLSEKREKVEAARREKLRKVSEAKERETKKDMPSIKEEPQSKSPSKSPPKSPSKTPEIIPKPQPPEPKETAPEQKFATLPRGFKAKAPAASSLGSSRESSKLQPSDKLLKDNAISEEIEGMMSAIKAVDRAITQEEQEIKILRDSLARNLPESVESNEVKPSVRSPSHQAQRLPVVKEVQAIPPEQVLAPTPREEQDTSTPSVPIVRQGTPGRINEQRRIQDSDRKKSEVEIVLNKKKPEGEDAEMKSKRSSYAEIQLSSPTVKEAPKQEFKTEVRHNVAPSRGAGEAQLQRAKRERIIPIMLEDDDDEDDRTTSESLSHSERPVGTSSTTGSRVTSPLPSQPSFTRPAETRPAFSASPESLRKSRRERIIPIAVEGEGIVTPPPHIEEAAELGAARAHQAFSRTMAGRPNALNRGRGFLLDHSESFSSAGEEEEEDEDDGFQILTAESLFSTLLNRVRSLTRKMNADDMRSDRARRISNQPTPEPGTAPSSAGIGAAHSNSSGFWSSLYNSPRDSPARRISETMSRSSLGRDDDTFGGISSPLWNRSVSRDTSDADTLFSEASTPFGTLPRGWRAPRWSGAEDGGESDTSEASARSLGRRPQYSRVPSRELHNIPDEDLGLHGGRPYPGGGMSLPRPYPGTSGGYTSQGRMMHDSADRIASMYGTLRGPHRRPHSTVGGHPGEALGRDGGHCERQMSSGSAAHTGVQSNQHASQLSPSSSVLQSPEDTEALKQSVQEQLQQLVRELEAGDEQLPKVPQAPPQPEQPQSSQQGYLSPSGTTMLSPPATPMFTPPTTPMQPQKSLPGSSDTHTLSRETTPYTTPSVSGSQIPFSPMSPVQSIQTPLTSPSPLSPVHFRSHSADAPTLTGGNDRLTTANRGPAFSPGPKTANQVSSPTPLSQTGGQDRTSRGFIGRLGGNEQQVGYNAILDISRERATSPVSSEGSDLGHVRRVSSSNEEWPKPSGAVVRSVDTTALEAYRRSRGKADKLEYQRGKSEDLRHTIDSLERLENHKNRSTASRPPFCQPTLEEVTYSNVGEFTRTSNGTPAMTAANLQLHNQLVANSDINNASESTNNNEYVNVQNKTSSVPSAPNSQNGLPTSRSASGIPVKSNSRGSLSTRSSFSGNSVTGTKPGELLQPKTYKRSKSKELTPAIEAAGEKLSQLNSGTLKRISPFEAYRRTKSRELPVEAVSRDARIKSPPPAGPERAKSPFERARSSIEKKFERAKSPIAERAANRKSDFPPGKAPPTPIMTRGSTFVKDGEQMVETTKTPNPEQVLVSEKDKEPEKEKMKETEKDTDKDKLKDHKVKKTSSCDAEKPKSMYKLLASRFNRSGSNVPETSSRSTEKRADDEDVSEKDDKFHLKRPSRFLKQKTEKSSSKSSVCDEDGSERLERKPSKKLTDALNKFLGRKESKEEHRPAVNSSQPPTLSITGAEDEHPKKPPRVKGKKFSKSHENLCLTSVAEGTEAATELQQAIKTQASASDVPATTANPGFTLESVTKSICDHLSQLESDITSRIGNIGVQEQGTVVRPTGTPCRLPTASSVPSLTTYGLSPALASRRNARPTNLDLAAAGIDNHKTPQASQAQTVTTASKDSNHIPTSEIEGVKYAQIKKLGGAAPSEDGSQTPTESGESTTSGPDDQRGASENDDESVMDRITRKSYYSRFQEIKKPKLRRANTKEDMDQQLAAAKARLMKEDQERAMRETLSPIKYTSPLGSPRANVTSPPSWENPRRHSRKSLPPEDLSQAYSSSGRRGTSLQPDDLPGIRRLSSIQSPETTMGVKRRLPSMPPEDRIRSYRAPSTSRDSLASRRMKSIPPEDRSQGLRSPSAQPEDLGGISSPTSPEVKADDNAMPDVVAAAAAAGALAGEVAAVAASDGTKERGKSKSREPSMSRLKSPEPTESWSSAKDESRTQAREELSRRLTHLTRISGTSGLAAAKRNVGLAGGNAADGSGIRPYRRTNTTGLLGEPTSIAQGPGTGAKTLTERPVYRRTNTMDLPPADARARPGSEYRRMLQDPARRYSAARTLMEDEALNTTPTRTNSRLTSPSQQSTASSNYRNYSTLDSPRYSSASSSITSPLSRRTSFYRY